MNNKDITYLLLTASDIIRHKYLKTGPKGESSYTIAKILREAARNLDDVKVLALIIKKDNVIVNFSVHRDDKDALAYFDSFSDHLSIQENKDLVEKDIKDLGYTYELKSLKYE